MADERRLKRKEIRHRQSESVWLQKAVFALGKAEAAHQEVADVKGEAAAPYTVPLDGREVAIHDIEDALSERAEKLTKTVREMRRSLG